uniref:Zf-C3Hc3H domain-containing protein n=2 Tax=Anopheles gambiae TaxID=7165 RepID=A0A2Y9D2B8_ANOGA
MSCQSTTRAQEDPYAFTESAPLQTNSLAYANHSSAVSGSGNSSSSSSTSNSSSSNSNNATTTSTTIQTASSGASLLLTTTNAAGTASKDKIVTVSPSVNASSPATLKVRYNGVVATGPTIVRAPMTVGTTVPVFTKPVQIRAQTAAQGTATQPAQQTVTVGKLIKKVLPQQNGPMITTVVAGGTKIISRLQQSSQGAGGQQQLQPVISTAGGSILKFIKIPPQQLAKGTAAGGTTIPQGSFIQVTATGEGAGRKLLVNSGVGSNGVSPTISVATSTARIATGGTATVSRNVAGVTVVPSLPTGLPTKIRLMQPQMQGKLILQTSNSGTGTQIATPVSVATLRNTLVKQAQQQKQQQQQTQQQQTQQQQQQPQLLQQKQQQQQQQQILQQKTVTVQQQPTAPTPKQPQIIQQPLQQQQKSQPQLQPQKPTPSQVQQQPILLRQPTNVPQLKQKQILTIQTSQSLSQTLAKVTSPQQQQQQQTAKPQPLVQQSQTLPNRENADSTQHLLKPPVQSATAQQQPQQVASSKSLLQQSVPKQSLLLQQQQQPQPLQQSSKLTPSPALAVQSTAKPQPTAQQSQSLLLQTQRKQQQSVAVSPGSKVRPVQQPQKVVTSVAPVSLLTSSVVTTKGGSLLVKVNEPLAGKSAKDGASRTPVASPDVRRVVVQQQSLLVGSGNVAASVPPTPKARDQSPAANSAEKNIRPSPAPAASGAAEPKVAPEIAKKDAADAIAPSSTKDSVAQREIKLTEQPTPQESKQQQATKLGDSSSTATANGKVVRQALGRKSAASGKTPAKVQKTGKRTYSQHALDNQQQQPARGRTSSVEVNATIGGNISPLPLKSAVSSSPNVSPGLSEASLATTSPLASVKLEQEVEIKQEDEESADEKPVKQQRFAAPSVPGAVVVPSRRPKVKEWHAPGAYLFDLKDPGDESDDDAYDEFPNTLSFWYEESIAITVPESSTSSWGMNPTQRGTLSGSGRGGKNKSARRTQDAKFQIRMLSRDEQLELKKAYLQRRAVQCRNGLRMRSMAAAATKKRLESMAIMVAKLDKRRQAELNKQSEKTPCAHEGCPNSALVMTAHCYDHITEDTEQCLFQRCTAKFSDNSQCRVPVFDVSHELILCKEHAWKHDNHDKMSHEVKMHKKPTPAVALAPATAAPTPPAMAAGRKKLKPAQPPVMVRTQKRPKKKKKLTPLQQQILLQQQQYKQQFAMLHHHPASQGQAKQSAPAAAAAATAVNQLQRPTAETKLVLQQQQPQQPQQQQRSLLTTSYSNGKVQRQVKVSSPVALSKATPTPVAAQPVPRQQLLANGVTKSPPKPVQSSNMPSHPTAQASRQSHIPAAAAAAVANSRTGPVSVAGSTVYRAPHNNSATAKIVEQIEHDHEQQQLSQQHGNAPPSVNTQDLLTICENSSAYASSEDTGVGGLSESELLATQDVIEEIIPFEFSNLLHPNVLSHLPQDALNELLCLGAEPVEDDTGDSHESCPREVEDDIERALEHVKSLDDMAVEPSSLLGDFLDNVDDEMLDGSDMCTDEQMLQPSNKTGEIRGMVHT